MNRKRVNPIICFVCILVVLLIAFSGCSTGEKTQKQIETEESSEGTLENEEPQEKFVQSNIPNEVFCNMYWKNIKMYASFIGKNIFEVTDKMADEYQTPCSWYWNEGEEEFARLSDGQILYFSEPAWNNSTCSAVIVSGEYISDCDNEENFDSENIENFFGTGYTYHKSDKRGEGYYQYVVDGYKVKVYETPKGGVNLSDIYIIVEVIDENLKITEVKHIDEDKDVPFEKESRDPKKWHKLDKYINALGKSEREVLARGQKWKKEIYSKGTYYYVDKDKNIEYYFYDESDSICYRVFVPVTHLIEFKENETLSMKDIVELYGFPVNWSNYDGGYRYIFEDAYVTLYCDDRGQINEKNWIMIE